MVITVDDCGLEWSRSDGIIHKADYDDLIEAYEELKKYKDAEKQGKLLLLPCKEGTRAFEIVCDCDFPGSCDTKRMCKGCEYRRLYIEPIILVTKIDILWKQEEFGKTVFFTKAEAEKALKEMGESKV